jgi:hypothetical protein
MNNKIGPVGPRSEFEGRKVINAFGTEEISIIPQSSWDYFDWCVEQGWDMAHWTSTIDKIRIPSLTIGENMWGALWKLECSRFKQGLSGPRDTPPEGYADFLDDLERGEYDEVFP